MVQRVGHADAGHADRGRKTARNGREQGDGDAEAQHARIHVNIVQARQRNVRCADTQQRIGARVREQQAEAARHSGEEEAFNQHLSDETPP